MDQQRQKLEELQTAYAVAYSRRARVLAAAGLDAQEIEKRLGAIDPSGDPREQIKAGRVRLYNELPTEQLEEREKAFPLRARPGAGISPHAIARLIQGDPGPLIREAIASALGHMAQARSDRGRGFFDSLRQRVPRASGDEPDATPGPGLRPGR